MVCPFMLIEAVVRSTSHYFGPIDSEFFNNSWIITEKLLDAQMGNKERGFLTSASPISPGIPAFFLRPKSMNSEPFTIPHGPIFPSWLAEAIFLTKLSIPAQNQGIVFIFFSISFPVFMVLFPMAPTAIDAGEQQKDSENDHNVFHGFVDN